VSKKDTKELVLVNVTLVCEQEQIQAHKYFKEGVFPGCFINKEVETNLIWP
jgi:hypothetical protein